MSYRDVSLLCFEGCVNAINSFIEKGTEYHTRIAARKRRGLIIIMIKINWKFSGLWNLKRGVLQCNIATLRRRKSESVIHEFKWQIFFSVHSFEF